MSKIVTGPWWAEHGVPPIGLIKTLIQQNQEQTLLNYGCISSKGCAHRAYRRCREPLTDFSFQLVAEAWRACIDMPTTSNLIKFTQTLQCGGNHGGWDHHLAYHWFNSYGYQHTEGSVFGPPPCSLCTVNRDEVDDGRKIFVTECEKRLNQLDAEREREERELEIERLRHAAETELKRVAAETALNTASYDALSLTWA